MIRRWIAVLGIVGFVCGFVGPIVLAPEANQGPMLGIFITGPGGALLGLVLGGALSLFGVSRPTNARLLWGVSIALAVATLYFCIPRPHH